MVFFLRPSVSLQQHRVCNSILFLTSLFKSFWLTPVWGWQCGLTSLSTLIYSNCMLSEKKKSSSTKCSIMDDTCRHKVLSLVWEREMSNHALEVSVGETSELMSLCSTELECMFPLYFPSVAMFRYFYHCHPEQQLHIKKNNGGLNCICLLGDNSQLNTKKWNKCGEFQSDWWSSLFKLHNM